MGKQAEVLWESTDASWRIHQWYVREIKSEKKRGRQRERGREGEGERQEEGKRGRE